MKLDFGEIWPFLKIVGEEAPKWSFNLVAGNFVSEKVPLTLIRQLESDSYYDAEMLPNLFTFREVFWQPNVYPTLNACLTGLKLVANYSNELTEEYANSTQKTQQLYVSLVKHIGDLARQTNKQLAGSEQASDRIPSVLGEFRKQSFPVIMLFIHHPMNRIDYKEDALRRINFMVKTLIEQYQLRFNDLLLPHWELDRLPDSKKTDSKQTNDQPPESPSEASTESPT
ncbi:MAG: hypothetical protein RIG68_13310 [Imperialibacter sp.]|uniref:hypothetical protein n=1 Tax=Imperialibacter sp. TaxID=2038411 RepID=UPI0032ECFB27